MLPIIVGFNEHRYDFAKHANKWARYKPYLLPL